MLSRRPTNISTTTPQALFAVPRFGLKLCIRALSTNTGIVTVYGAGNTAADGFQLAAGEGLDDISTSPHQIYVIASAANQGVEWGAS